MINANRLARLAQIAAAHDEWVEANVDGAAFNPDSRPDSDDYNLWYLDMDATPAAEAKFQQMVEGL